MDKLDKQKLLNYLEENFNELNVSINKKQQNENKTTKDKTKTISYYGALLACKYLTELINNGVFDIE